MNLNLIERKKNKWTDGWMDRWMRQNQVKDCLQQLKKSNNLLIRQCMAFLPVLKQFLDRAITFAKNNNKT